MNKLYLLFENHVNNITHEIDLETKVFYLNTNLNSKKNYADDVLQYLRRFAHPTILITNKPITPYSNFDSKKKVGYISSKESVDSSTILQIWDSIISH